MDNKRKFWGIIAIVAVVLVVGIYFANFSALPSNSTANESDQEGSNSDSTINSVVNSNGTKNDESVPGNSQGGDGQEKPGIISSAEARSIAQKLIPELLAGEPTLFTVDGEKIYSVPVLYPDTKKMIGEIYINAQTGEYIGDSGGFP